MTRRVGADAPVLEVCGLAKRCGDFQAVHDVSFEVAHGEIFGLLGPNGAGKTTTVESHSQGAWMPTTPARPRPTMSLATGAGVVGLHVSQPPGGP